MSDEELDALVKIFGNPKSVPNLLTNPPFVLNMEKGVLNLGKKGGVSGHPPFFPKLG